MSNTATNGKPAAAESDPSVAQNASAEQTKQEVSAAEKALTEERNKLQEDLKELKVISTCLLTVAFKTCCFAFFVVVAFLCK